MGQDRARPGPQAHAQLGHSPPAIKSKGMFSLQFCLALLTAPLCVLGWTPEGLLHSPSVHISRNKPPRSGRRARLAVPPPAPATLALLRLLGAGFVGRKPCSEPRRPGESTQAFAVDAAQRIKESPTVPSLLRFLMTNVCQILSSVFTASIK